MTGGETEKQSKQTALLTIDEACKRLGGLSRWSVYRLINAKQLESVKPNRRRFVPADAVEAYIDRLRSEGRF